MVIYIGYVLEYRVSVWCCGVLLGYCVYIIKKLVGGVGMENFRLVCLACFFK